MPTRRSPSAVKATTEGVVLAPSAFSSTWETDPVVTSRPLNVSGSNWKLFQDWVLVFDTFSLYTATEHTASWETCCSCSLWQSGFTATFCVLLFMYYLFLTVGPVDGLLALLYSTKLPVRYWFSVRCQHLNQSLWLVETGPVLAWTVFLYYCISAVAWRRLSVAC